MIVSACHDGHGTFGVRVLARDVGLFFRPEWRWVTLRLPDDPRPAAIPLSDGFWRSSPELRSARVRDFLVRNNLVHWPAQRPPHFCLEPLGGGQFRLDWLERRHGQAELFE